MIAEIKKGTEVKCLTCKKSFAVEEIRFGFDMEFITCPHCKVSSDVQFYHLHGEQVA